MYFKIPVFIFFIALTCTNSAQTKIEAFWDKKVEAAKGKIKRNTTDVWDKKREDYDESNFNYAILFLDNSGMFEAEEKGNRFMSGFASAMSFAYNDNKTEEEQAYQHLKNGEMFMAGNKFYLAEVSLLKAQKIFEDYHKTESHNYSQTLSDLGLLYQSKGIYSKAEPFNLKAIELRKTSINKGMYIVSVNNQAVLKKETGQYTEAEAGLKEALEIAKSSGDSLAKALVYNNLAMTCLDMNNLKNAESFMILSIAEAGKVMKDNATNYIKLQINLANVYRFQKKYQEAEKIYLKAIEVKEKKLGTHPDLAHLKKGLAQLYMEMGKTSEVEELLTSAWHINRKKLGEKNPATLNAHQELANYYRFSGRPGQAVEIMNEVAGYKKDIYGQEHLNYIQALEDLALAQWQYGRHTDAKVNYKLVIDNTMNYISKFFNTLNDTEKNLYWEKTNTRLQRFYSYSMSNYENDNELTSMIYNTVINTKGFLLNNSSKIRNIIATSTDESLKQAYRQWMETSERLNYAYQLSKDEIAEQKINIDSLKGRNDELERQLSQKSAEFREASSASYLTHDSIQKTLKENEAAVEIIQLNDYQNGFTGNGSYVALVIKPKDLKLVKLGKTTEIDTAVLVFRNNIIDQKPENEGYAKVWEALDAELKGVTRVFLSLDGAYHQLSVNALRDEQGNYLLDRYQIQFVGNTRDVLDVKKNEAQSVKPSSAFLVGNPLYGKSGMIDQLPGTEQEVKNIAKLLNTQKVKATALFGKEATESKVKQINSPGILHIATHGYFLADLSQMETSKVLGVDIGAAKENPLLRSGVLLAGCDNVFDPGYRQDANSENGVLTAFEAMNLHLDNTDLVVLSACETGLGSVKQGEGVYGLQRAFLIAGAKSIIMSLWAVSDEATMELMTHFYTAYAKSGNKQAAFSEAMRHLKVKYKDPYFWSAFVMLHK